MVNHRNWGNVVNVAGRRANCNGTRVAFASCLLNARFPFAYFARFAVDEPLKIKVIQACSSLFKVNQGQKNFATDPAPGENLLFGSQSSFRPYPHHCCGLSRLPGVEHAPVALERSEGRSRIQNEFASTRQN